MAGADADLGFLFISPVVIFQEFKTVSIFTPAGKK
jgi:hypothetical protein